MGSFKDSSKKYGIDGDIGVGGESDLLGNDPATSSGDGAGNCEQGNEILDLVLGGPDSVFMSDAFGRRYKTNVLIGTRVGKFGRKATTGLEVLKPPRLRAQD